MGDTSTSIETSTNTPTPHYITQCGTLDGNTYQTKGTAYFDETRFTLFIGEQPQLISIRGYSNLTLSDSRIDTMAGIRFEHHPFRVYGTDANDSNTYQRPFMQAMEDSQDADTTVVITVLHGGVMMDILDRKIQKFDNPEEVVKETYNFGPATDRDSFEKAFNMFKMHRASNPCVLFNFTGVEIKDLTSPVLKWDGINNADQIPESERVVVPFTKPAYPDK